MSARTVAHIEEGRGNKAHSEPQVTLLLQRWDEGDTEALEELIPLVYRELLGLARAQLRRDSTATIQPTELVAEAYLKITGTHGVDWQGRAHFFSFAARTMRRVLVERFRARSATKRGGDQVFLTFEEETGPGQRQLDLEALEDALQALEALDQRQAEIVTMRFYGGLGVDEVAQVLDISPRTVKREWAFARRWLFLVLEDRG